MIRRMKHKAYVIRRVEELRMEILNLALIYPYKYGYDTALAFKAKLLHRYEERLLCL